MSQLRFVGLTEDLTQEIHLLMLQAVTQPKIVSGMNVSIQTVGNDLYLLISPGVFIMPDGMVVEETTQVSIPLIAPTANQDYDVTVIAYRSTDPGIMNDEVFYQILTGKQYSATIGNIISTTNKVSMPISWINYIHISQTYTVTNLGDRSSDNYLVFKSPFENLVTDSTIVVNNVDTKTIPVSPGPYTITVYGAPTFTDDLGVYNVTNSAAMVRVASGPVTGQYSVNLGIYTFSSVDAGDQVKITYLTGQGKSTRLIDNDLVDSLKSGSIFYFRIPMDSNQFISSIAFEGKSATVQTISIKSMTNSDSRLNQNYLFSTTSFQTQTLTDPTTTYMDEDLLEITITGGSAFYLKTITVNKTRIF